MEEAEALQLRRIGFKATAQTRDARKAADDAWRAARFSNAVLESKIRVSKLRSETVRFGQVQ